MNLRTHKRRAAAGLARRFNVPGRRLMPSAQVFVGWVRCAPGWDRPGRQRAEIGSGGVKRQRWEIRAAEWRQAAPLPAVPADELVAT